MQSQTRQERLTNGEAARVRQRDKATQDAKALRAGGQAQRSSNLDQLARGRAGDASAMAAAQADIDRSNDPIYKRHAGEEGEDAEEAAAAAPPPPQADDVIRGMALRGTCSVYHANLKNTKVLILPAGDVPLGDDLLSSGRDKFASGPNWYNGVRAKVHYGEQWDGMWHTFCTKHDLVYNGQFEHYASGNPLLCPNGERCRTCAPPPPAPP